MKKELRNRIIIIIVVISMILPMVLSLSGCGKKDEAAIEFPSIKRLYYENVKLMNHNKITADSEYKFETNLAEDELDTGNDDYECVSKTVHTEKTDSAVYEIIKYSVNSMGQTADTTESLCQDYSKTMIKEDNNEWEEESPGSRTSEFAMYFSEINYESIQDTINNKKNESKISLSEDKKKYIVTRKELLSEYLESDEYGITTLLAYNGIEKDLFKDSDDAYIIFESTFNKNDYSIDTIQISLNNNSMKIINDMYESVYNKQVLNVSYKSVFEYSKDRLYIENIVN